MDAGEAEARLRAQLEELIAGLSRREDGPPPSAPRDDPQFNRLVDAIGRRLDEERAAATSAPPPPTASSRDASTVPATSVSLPSPPPHSLAQAAAPRPRRPDPGSRRQSASVLRYIIAHLPHSIFWKDRELRYLGANQNFLRDMGVASEADVVGKNDYDMPSREQAEWFRRIDREVMESGAPRLDVEEQQLRHDGLHVLSTSKVPLRDDSGAITGILGIYIDITERKQMEEALRRAKEQAEAAARAKDDFLTMVSHELRTPLTLILGPLEALLASDARAPEIRAPLERVVRNAWRLQRLVSDILDAARLDAGRMPVRWERLDAAALVAGVVDDARPAAERAGVALTFSSRVDLAGGASDRGKLEKIALNLVGNAIKFTPAGGRVTVELVEGPSNGEAPAAWELSVRDTGPGIAPRDQPRLFQRFEQLDSSLTRRHEGTGLGLALVKEFATLLGGAVGVESEPGHGARFWVRLPRDAPRGVPLDEVRAPAADFGALAAPSGDEEIGPLQLRGSTLAVAALDHSTLAGNPALAPSSTPSTGQTAIEAALALALAGTGAGAARVLIVDDNADLRAYVRELLAGELVVEEAADGAAALAAARARPPDVIVSDIMMPGMDGYELVAHLKADERLRAIPVVLLTAKVGTVVTALEAGADDYLAKPFSPAELRARVRAAVRLHRLYATLVDEKARLVEAQEQLVQSAKMAAVGTLVAGLAHELNNPLGVILVGAQSAARRIDDTAAVEQALASIARHARRAGQLVTTLLDVARKKPRARAPIAPAALIARVVELAEPQATRRDVRIVAPVDETLPLVSVTLQEIESALLNVVANAVDASPPGGLVRVSSRRESDGDRPGVAITVSDEGAGIPPAALGRIFDPFFTLKPVGEGTGLGLFIARGVVVSHGGRVQVASEPGDTRFTLWLPLRETAAEKETR